MPTVTTVFRKDKLNKKGLGPIHFRIIKHRKPKYIASGLMIKPENWDEKNAKIKSNHKQSARLNSFLANKYTEILDSVFYHETISKNMTSKNLKEQVFGKPPVEYFKFAESILERYKNEGKIGTYQKNYYVIEKLKKYCKNKEITFNDITYTFLLNFEVYLRKVLKNKTNTVHKDMKFHRKLFNEAIRQDTIPYEINPFRKYQLKLEKTHRDYLTEAELTKIESYHTLPGSILDLHKNMFIFASYTGGLRISDILKMKWNDFDGTHLHVVIKKTGVQVSIKVPNKGLEILNCYKSEKQINTFIFPVLNNTLNLENPVEADKAITSATAHINKNLKIIAKKVEIEKNLSFHVSRHTWAVRALQKGISIDKVSKIMAHSAIRETQIYAKIVNEDLDIAMDIFNN